MRLPLRGVANQTWRRRTFQIARLLMRYSQSPNWGRHPRQSTRQSQAALGRRRKILPCARDRAPLAAVLSKSLGPHSPIFPAPPAPMRLRRASFRRPRGQRQSVVATQFSRTLAAAQTHATARGSSSLCCASAQPTKRLRAARLSRLRSSAPREAITPAFERSQRDDGAIASVARVSRSRQPRRNALARLLRLR